MRPPIFVSGPHGAGKTTLINRLAGNSGRFLVNDYDIDFPSEFPTIKYMSHFETCLVRLYHRIYSAEYARQLAVKTPQRVVITSRGIYDSKAYIHTYHTLGWITRKQADKLNFVVDSIDETLYNTIILNPKTSVVSERLSIRKTRGERKERDILFNDEDTEDFLEILGDFFLSLKDKRNILFLEDNGEDDFIRIEEWLESVWGSARGFL